MTACGGFGQAPTPVGAVAVPPYREYVSVSTFVPFLPVQVQLAVHTELCGPSPSETTPGALKDMLQNDAAPPVWTKVPPTEQAPSLVLTTVMAIDFVAGYGAAMVSAAGAAFTFSVPGIADSERPVHEAVSPGGRYAPPNSAGVETPVTMVNVFWSDVPHTTELLTSFAPTAVPLLPAHCAVPLPEPCPVQQAYGVPAPVQTATGTPASASRQIGVIAKG